MCAPREGLQNIFNLEKQRAKKSKKRTGLFTKKKKNIKNIKVSLLLNFKSFSFLDPFEWFIELWFRQLKFYKISWNLICNRPMFEDLKLQNTNYLNYHIIKHLPPLLPKGVSCSFLHKFEPYLWHWMCHVESYNISLSSKGNRRMSTNLGFFVTLNCTSPLHHPSPTTCTNINITTRYNT